MWFENAISEIKRNIVIRNVANVKAFCILHVVETLI